MYRLLQHHWLLIAVRPSLIILRKWGFQKRRFKKHWQIVMQRGAHRDRIFLTIVKHDQPTLTNYQPPPAIIIIVVWSYWTGLYPIWNQPTPRGVSPKYLVASPKTKSYAKTANHGSIHSAGCLFLICLHWLLLVLLGSFTIATSLLAFRIAIDHCLLSAFSIFESAIFNHVYRTMC